ncbi:MAG: hypothetical protein JJ979_06180 [Roseibium sp.]|nr:hypothetical protein [Roseibium sp.]
MTDRTPKKGLKSVGGKAPMRSRGFLSQPGGPVSKPEDRDASTQHPEQHHKSRGARQVSVSRDRQPEDLASPAPIKPYILDDK